MHRYAKRADARITYAVAWSPAAIGADAIRESGWSVEPEEPGGLALEEASLDGRRCAASFTGGRPGARYAIRNSVIGATGGRASRGFAIEVAR